MLRCRCIFAILALFSITIGFDSSHAQYYEEEFDDTLLRDPGTTTANWNTQAGRVELHPITLNTVGSLDSSGRTWDARVEGEYLYLADGTEGLRVLRISDPTAPVDVGGYNTAGDTRSVCIEGNTLYIADGSLGMRSFDISDPDTPVSLGMYNTPGFAWKVDVYGDLAAVADLSSLQILDISDPATPTLLASIATPGNCRDVHLDGDFAYTAQDGAGLYIYDISDPTAPVYHGANTIPDRALGLHIFGEMAFVADYSDGLRIFDIGNRSSPVLRGTYDTAGLAQRVFVSGDECYVADGGTGLVVLDITDITDPRFIASLPVDDLAIHVSVRGMYAYVSDRDAGVKIVDVGDPAAPCNAGIFDNGGNNPYLSYEGDLAFVADADSTVEILNVEDWRNPVLIGDYVVPGGANVWQCVPAGDLLYVGTHGSGPTSASLRVLDISHPPTPVEIGFMNLYKVAWIVPHGDHLWLSTYNSVSAVDVSDPTNPFFAGSYLVGPSQCYALAIEGDVAYVANGSAGLLVLDISDPTAPSYLGSYATPASVVDISVDGDHCYVSGWSTDLLIFDVTDPTTPVLVGSYAMPSGGLETQLQWPFLFISEQVGDLIALDITNPALPVFDHMAHPYGGRGLRLNGGLIAVCHSGSGVYFHPVLQRHYDVSGNRVQSLDLHPGSNPVVWVELNSSESGEIQWEVTADGGANWQIVHPLGFRYTLSQPGGDLRWRATFEEPDCDADPHIETMDLTWRAQGPILQSISDVPGDQGGWVRIAFVRSAYDDVDETNWPIAHYYVHREVEDPYTIAEVLEEGQLAKILPEAWPTDLAMWEWEDRRFTVVEDASTTKRVVWEVVASAPAMQLDGNLVLAPTLADSTDHLFETNFRISAHAATPTVWFFSDPMRGYSVDNIAPGVPTGLSAEYQVEGVQLRWDASTAEDFQYFRIYRSSDPGFVPSERWLVHQTEATDWGDHLPQPWGMYYKVTALDYVGNESPPAVPGHVTDAGGTPPAIERLALHQNHPNPFNPRTTISFDLPIELVTHLGVYDVGGRKIRALVNGEMRPAGRNVVIWDGKDGQGLRLSSGIYYYRIVAGGTTITRRMVLLR